MHARTHCHTPTHPGPATQHRQLAGDEDVVPGGELEGIAIAAPKKLARIFKNMHQLMLANLQKQATTEPVRKKRRAGRSLRRPTRRFLSAAAMPQQSWGLFCTRSCRARAGSFAASCMHGRTCEPRHSRPPFTGSVPGTPRSICKASTSRPHPRSQKWAVGRKKNGLKWDLHPKSRNSFFCCASSNLLAPGPLPRSQKACLIRASPHTRQGARALFFLLRVSIPVQVPIVVKRTLHPHDTFCACAHRQAIC